MVEKRAEITDETNEEFLADYNLITEIMSFEDHTHGFAIAIKLACADDNLEIEKEATLVLRPRYLWRIMPELTKALEAITEAEKQAAH